MSITLHSSKALRGTSTTILIQNHSMQHTNINNISILTNKEQSWGMLVAHDQKIVPRVELRPHLFHSMASTLTIKLGIHYCAHIRME